MRNFDTGPLKTWNLWICCSGDQGQDVGRKGRGVEEDAGDAGTDAGDDENAWIHGCPIFQTISSQILSQSSKPYLYPRQKPP